jgi:hypothetical protein
MLVLLCYLACLGCFSIKKGAVKPPLNSKEETHQIQAKETWRTQGELKVFRSASGKLEQLATICFFWFIPSIAKRN